MYIQNLNKTYHNLNNEVHALKDLSFAIDHVGITMILGASGCGKTTLLNIIAGKDHDYTGSVEVIGTVQYIEQDIRLMESMSIRENLLLVSKDEDKITEVLDTFHLIQEQHKKVKKLSLGQKKRVQALQSILSDCDLLLCDEPTASLDHDNAILVMEELKHISKTIPVLIVTHDHALATAYADLTYHMESGKLVKDQTEHHTNAIVKQPSTKQKPNLSLTSFILRYSKTRPAETMFRILISVLFILLCYLSCAMFQSMTSASDRKTLWQTGANIIIPQANKENYAIHNQDKEYRREDANCKEGGSCAFYYDIYTQEDINTVLQEVDGIIGYRSGWDLSLYTLSFFHPDIPYREAEKVVSEYQKRELSPTMKTIIDHMTFEMNEYYKGAPDSVLEKATISDWRNMEGFALNQDGNSTFISPLGRIENRIATNYNRVVVPYQIKDDKQLPILYGAMMSHDDEIVISYNTAELLVHDFEIEEIKNLIGKEIVYELDSINPEIEPMLNKKNETRTFKIAGITDVSIDHEAQVYFKEGVYNEWRNSFYHMNEPLLKYQYVYFISDPAFSIETISQQINEVLPGTYSTFVSYQDSLLKSDSNKENYQNPSIFMIYISLLLLLCMISMITYERMTHQRQQKEESILLQFGYDIKKRLLLEFVYINIPGLLLWTAMIPFFLHVLDERLQAFQFANAMQFSLPVYLLCTIAGMSLLLLLRYGFYKLRNRRT